MSLIKILGCSGSIGEHGYTTSLLINNDTLIDAGSGLLNQSIPSLKKINQINNIAVKNFIICGGGRKNKKLVENIYKHMGDEKLIIKDIDAYQFDGDFIESQAFGYLAIRSFLNLPISYPKTTGCVTPTVGGKLAQSF